MAKDDETTASSGGLGGLLGKVQPMLGKMKSVDPKTAKTSAARSATSTKELVQLSIGYLKQETKAPLAGIGRYLALGMASAVLFATSSVLLLLGLLRGIQAAWAYERPTGERGPMSGSLSWLPYALSAVGCVLVIGLLAVAFQRGSKKPATSGGSK